MEASIYTYGGEDTGRKATLPEDLFNIDPNEHIVYLDVKRILASKRQGTHSAKEKGQIKGSTRKLRKQKGTGNARVGSIKSPIFRGGGRIFGPRPRDYSFKVNEKERRLAKRSVLSDKARKGKIVVLEAFSLDSPKTKLSVQMLGAFLLAEKKVLFVMEKSDKNFILSTRNIPSVKTALAANVNTYDILNADTLVLFEKAIESIVKI